MRLPVFAYQVTGDPHAFDENQPAGQLLGQMLTSMAGANVTASLMELATVEQRHGLLAAFHLLKDDIMNYAAVRGLIAFTAGGTENQMWQAACLEGVSWNVPLKEILRMEQIRPFSGEKVLVVENSGIHSILVDLLPEVPIICSSGQFTFAIWQLLRKLAVGKSQIYYSGDLDPEGLGMAQKLKNTFGDQLLLLGMDSHNFQRGRQASELKATRLKKLNSITDQTLSEVATLIKQDNAVAYQEGFLPSLISEIEWEFA